MTMMTMISATPSSELKEGANTSGDFEAVTDSIPRIRVLDLAIALRAFLDGGSFTLDALRVKLSLDRGDPVHALSNYSVARDVAGELARQGYADVGPLPKASKEFEKKRELLIYPTSAGIELAVLLRAKATRRQAYRRLLSTTYAAHPYFRRYVAALATKPMFAPTITSAERHIGERYGSARVLMEDVGAGKFDTPSLLNSLERRLERSLTKSEVSEIEGGVSGMTSEAFGSVKLETQTEFARKLLSRLNEIVVPSVLRDDGLGFDFNTLRRLWKFGQEFQLGWATSTHPRFDGWLFFNTARIEHHEPEQIELSFDNSLESLRFGFLERAFAIYQQLQDWGASSFVPSWELRAAFCFEHRCAPGVFDTLFARHYNGDEQYRVEKEFLRAPPHVEPLVLGGRQIGLIRLTK
jgi:hypothetical protein